MNRMRWIAGLLVLLPVLACTILTPATPAPITPTSSPVPPLTADMLRNATYHLPQFGLTVTFTDGEYHNGSDTEPVNAWLTEPFAFSDINGDGALDAAVLLSENGGGTGTFVSVVVMLNQAGHPEQSHDATIDDRPIISGISAVDGRIMVEAVLHASDDAACCPTFSATQTWHWSPARLTLVRFSSRTPTDQERAILINSPVSGASVSGSVAVQGTVTIAPFENTLAYRFYNLGETKLSEGSIMVDAADFGGPGTINVSIPLPAVAVGTHIRLELLDLSAKDGAMLAMDSVELQVSGE